MANALENEKLKNDQLNELLENYSGAKDTKEEEEVIYGVYDNSSAGLTTRINDWLIDHSKVGLKDKAYFFHLLAVMIDSGIPLLQSLNLLKKRSKNLRFKRVIATIHHSVGTGKKLSDAMARFPDVFTEQENGVVRSGESVGRLNDMLNRLSVQLDKNHALQMKLYSASIYPLAVLSVLIIVGTAMMIWIVPNLLGILNDSGLSPSEYPLSTKILIGITDGITNYWWAILIGSLALYGLFQIFTHTTVGKFKWDYYKLRMPVIGELLKKVYVLRFVRTLGILIASGLPVIKSLQIIASSTENELYKLKTWQIIGKVRAGQKISENIENAPFLFPDTVSRMISIAEKTAALGSISEKIGDHYDQEINNSLKTLTSLFEPLMIIFVALAVALLALGVLQPIFQLTQVV